MEMQVVNPLRLTQFEVMRGVAALQVLAVHYEDYFVRRKQYFPDLNLFLPYYPGAVGMVLFFVLSGFVISYSYFDRLRDGNHRIIGKYIAQRYARLWPLHVTTLVCVLLFRIPHESGNHWSLAANALLFHAVFPYNGSLFNYNGPSWSIGVEMVCYQLFILLCLASRRLHNGWLALLAVIGIYIGYKGFTTWSLPLSGCSAYVGCGFQVLKYSSAFVLGMSLFLSLRILDPIIGYSVRLQRLFKGAATLSMLLFLFYGYLKHWWSNSPKVPMGDWEWLILSTTWVSFTYLSRGIESSYVRWNPVYYAGIASYSIYLWHQIILMFIDRKVGTGEAYLLSVASTFLISAFSYQLIETPPRRWVARSLAAYSFRPG